MIKQSFWSIEVRQYTKESRSESRAAIWAQTSGGNLLTYTYANQPRHEIEGRSRPHLGTAALDVVGLRPEVLHGGYFTDRYTKGDMDLRLVDRSADCPDFAAAHARFGDATAPEDAASPQPLMHPFRGDHRACFREYMDPRRVLKSAIAFMAGPRDSFQRQALAPSRRS